MFALMTAVVLSAILTLPPVDSDMQVYTESAATVDYDLAGIVNPAGLSVKYAMGFRYMHAFSDSTFKGDDGLILATRGIFVSVQFLHHCTDLYPNTRVSRRKFILASANRIMPNFHWGISYSQFGSSNDSYSKKKVWKTGLLFHPSPMLSLALVIDDFNRPKFGTRQVERHYTLAAAGYFYHGRIVVSADGYYTEKDKLDKVKALFRTEFKLSKHIKLAADYRTDGWLQFGIGYKFDYIETGGIIRVNNESYKGGSLYYDQGPVSNTR